MYSTIRYFLVAPSLLQTSSLEHNKYNKILLFLGKKQQGKRMKYTTKKMFLISSVVCSRRVQRQPKMFSCYSDMFCCAAVVFLLKLQKNKKKNRSSCFNVVFCFLFSNNFNDAGNLVRSWHYSAEPVKRGRHTQRIRSTNLPADEDF